MASSPAAPPRRSGLAQSRSRDTRRKLIHAALDMWNERGFEEAFEATTVAEIARAAGVSKGIFYFHFANKQEILLEVAWGTSRKMIEEADAGIRTSSSSACIRASLPPRSRYIASRGWWTSR